MATETRSGDHPRRVTYTQSGEIAADAREIGRPEETTILCTRGEGSNRIEKVTVTCSSSSPGLAVRLVADVNDDRGRDADFYENFYQSCRIAAGDFASNQ